MKSGSSWMARHGFRALIRWIAGFWLTVVAVSAGAVCSPDYHGLATINEVRQLSQGNNNVRYVEIKVLSEAVSAQTYADWTLSVCSAGGCTGPIRVGDMNDARYPWIVAGDSLIRSERYIDFGGMDVLLRDASGRTIDYLSVGTFSNQRDASCTPAFDYQVPGSNTKTLMRYPDGTGDWFYESGNSGDTSQGGSNDGGVSGPQIGIAGPTVFQGESAVFTVNLDAPAGRDLHIDFTTLDSTALAGIDYAPRSGTLDIPAGDRSGSVSVATNVTGSPDGKQFFLILSNARDNAGARYGSFVSQVGVAHILPAATGLWHLDEGSWTGAPGEVLDSSGNGLSGQAVNGVTGSDYGPAIPGNPGTCGYGEFDGSNQYMTVPDNDRLDLAGAFTISAWIYPTSLPTSGWWGGKNAFLHTIFSKDDNYEVHLNANGGIYWWWRQSAWYGASAESLTTNDGLIGLNQWNHVAVVYTDGRQRIYVNGVVAAESSQPGPVLNNNLPFQIGNDQDASLNRFFDGRLDEISVFASAISEEGIQAIFRRGHACPAATLGGFQIDVPATASVCAPAPITVRALESSGNVLQSYEGGVRLSTSSGSGVWSKDTASGSLSPSPDLSNDGSVEYTFVTGDNGVASFLLSNRTADELTVQALDPVSGRSSRSMPVRFASNAFVIDYSDPNGGDIVAERDHGLEVRAVASDPATGECGLVTDYDRVVSLKAWLSRSNNDAGGVPPDLQSGAYANAQPPSSRPAAANLSLDFSKGVAPLRLSTSDVGQYRLTLLDDQSGIVVDQAGQPLPVAGQSALWTVRPDRFELTVAGNPGASTASGAVFGAAGDPFELTLTAVGAAGNATPGYGQEADSQGANLSHDLVAPAGGNAGVLAGTLALPGGAFVNGETRAADLTWNEVGILRLTARNDSYLGVTPPITGSSGAVGRFVPARFEVAVDPGTLGAFCSSGTAFVYAGQPMPWSVLPEIRVTALSTGGNITKNYTQGGFQKLTANDVVVAPPGTDATATDLNGTGYPVNSVMETGVLSSVGPGLMTYSLSSNDRFTYRKSSEARIAPFTPDLRFFVSSILDSDGVSATMAPYGFTPAASFDIRYGRLFLENAYGPETLTALPMPFRVEYWNGSGFVTNTADSCTTWATTDITDTENYHSLDAASGTLSAGQGGPLSLVPDGTQGTDSLVWNVADWLEFDQDGDGTLEDPSALATFGVYRGHDRVIYWQEQ